MRRIATVVGFTIAMICLAIGGLRASRETIVFWYGATQDERAVYERMIAEFERANPEIRVNALLVPQSYVERKLILSIAGKAPPDVVRFYTHLGGELMARYGLEPLDDLVRRDNIDLNDFYPVALQQNSFRNRLYGMPWLLSPNALLYNVDLFRKAGLDPRKPPRNWDELVRYSLRLTKRDSRGAIEQLGFADLLNFNLFLWQNGGSLLSKDGNVPAFNSPEGKEALVWMRSFLDREVGDFTTLQAFNSSFKGAAQDAFGMGKVAMRIDSPFRIPDLRKYYPKLRFAVAPAPWSKLHTAEVVGNSLVVPRGSRHRDAAWEFIKFVTSREQMIKVCRAASRIPARRSAATSPAFYSEMRPFVDEIPYGRSVPVVPGYQQFAEALGRNLEPALKGELSAEEALSRADVECAAILDRALEDMSKYPLLPWRLLGLAAVGLLVAIAAFVFWQASQRTRGSRAARREAATFYLFISPWLIGFIVFTFGASLASLVFSFSKWDVLTPARFVGFRNYAELLGQDPRFLKTLGNTAYYTLFSVPLGIIAGLALSMLMNQKVRGIGIFRTVYYLPVVVSGVATVIVWRWLFDANTGMINRLLSTNIPWASLTDGFHFLWVPFIANPPKWLVDPLFAKPAFIIMSLWGIGGTMIIFLAALQSVPEELHEAAKLDGAGAWQAFRHVTLPLLTPAIFYQLIIGTIASFQVFTQAYLMTGGTGAPSDSTLFYVLYLYLNAFQWMRVGYGAAMAWGLFLIIMLVTLVHFKLAGRWVYYEGQG